MPSGGEADLWETLGQYAPCQDSHRRPVGCLCYGSVAGVIAGAPRRKTFFARNCFRALRVS